MFTPHFFRKTWKTCTVLYRISIISYQHRAYRMLNDTGLIYILKGVYRYNSVYNLYPPLPSGSLLHSYCFNTPFSSLIYLLKMVIFYRFLYPLNHPPSNFRPRHAAHLRRGRAQRAFEDDALVAPGLDDRQAVAPGTNWRRPVGGFTIGKP